ncbi:MAG: hypothetical protein F4Z95_07135 [Gammaproteobacteria bacterium]|nr:hypothetical protein [Gammaproteobacteria bacterium]
MDSTMVKKKLIGVLADIQSASGLDCPRLTGDTKPVGDLPEFDSFVWPVATTLLSQEIATPIPNDVNIFVDNATKTPKSIDEIAKFVSQLREKAVDKELEAA